MLSISKEDFLEIYKGLPICDDVDLFYSVPSSDKELIEKYLPSKLWRLNNLYFIIDKSGNQIKFKMNRSQHIAYATTLKHPRVIILKSRQQGISTFYLIDFFDDSITRKNLSIGLMAQGLNESATLLDRVKILWNNLNPVVKKYFNLRVDKDNSTEFSFNTKSKIYIRTSFRSGTLQRLHVSEMGKIANKYPEKARETKTGTLQALGKGNKGIIESTAEGDNDFKEMWDTAYTFTGARTQKDFIPLFLSWINDPDCVEEVDQVIPAFAEKYFKNLELENGIVLTKQQKNFWVTQYRELGDRIYQEYPATPEEAFKATREGTYYAESYLLNVKNQNRELTDFYALFDKNLEVFCAYDLGHNDTTVCTVYQCIKGHWRIIDEYADNGKDVKYYCDWMKSREWFWNLTEVNLPHDAENHSQTDGKTRAIRFEEELSYYITEDKQRVDIVNPPMVEVIERTNKLDGIDAVRALIPSLWVNAACTYLIKCFYNYSKEWNEKKQVYRPTPLHDEFSNGADSLRTMAMAGYKECDYIRRKDASSGTTYYNSSGMDI